MPTTAGILQASHQRLRTYIPVQPVGNFRLDLGPDWWEEQARRAGDPAHVRGFCQLVARGSPLCSMRGGVQSHTQLSCPVCDPGPGRLASSADLSSPASFWTKIAPCRSSASSRPAPGWSWPEPGGIPLWWPCGALWGVCCPGLAWMRACVCKRCEVLGGILCIPRVTHFLALRHLTRTVLRTWTLQLPCCFVRLPNILPAVEDF